MKIEVIMSAYNNVRDLELVLDGYLNQLDNDFSLCIADDGSTHEVADLIKKYSQSSLTIRHIWHEDKGFRKAKILNQAIETSFANYIIFTDSDCIPAPNFISDHRNVASKTTVSIGVRAYIKKDLSEAFRHNTISIDKLFNIPWLLYKSMTGDVSKVEQVINYPSFILKPIAKAKPILSQFGSNMAMPIEALFNVNGFDEDFEGWGYEDTDLLYRLDKLGLTFVGTIGRCRQFHLDHKMNARNPNGEKLFMQKKEDGKIYCDNGINKKA
ncbi:glycosyltransferase [Photobacterium leiognathi]|uniref:glycosyltransferase n=1 Tax=Photobacterium leiognathi TaxID=553611 RepID=UPI001F2632AD|nr:glycosyltransferase [Photobacterium leiognathi]